MPSSILQLITCLSQRKYFDSGDFALTAAHEASNIGRIQTGTRHPLVESVSHPSAPMPACSNVNDDKDHTKDAIKTIHASQLGQGAVSERDITEVNAPGGPGEGRE